MENNSVKMKTYCFGVDLGGTSVKLGLFSGVGDLLEKWEIATRKEASGAHILEDISASILGKMAEKGIKTPEVGGIGIGVPGPVLRGSFVTGCVNLGWKNVDVAGELSAMTGLSVVVANDANIAALGEQWQGGG